MLTQFQGVVTGIPLGGKGHVSEATQYTQESQNKALGQEGITWSHTERLGIREKRFEGVLWRLWGDGRDLKTFRVLRVCWAVLLCTLPHWETGCKENRSSAGSLPMVPVIQGQLHSRNIKWKFPEINSS